jgi:hypothetical protein
MNKKHLNWVTVGFAALAFLVVVMMVLNTIRRPGEIRLPDTDTVPDQSVEDTEQADDALTVIEITPDTVQTAVATLARPNVYQRTVTVEQFWNGGSAAYETMVTVNEAWTRTDRTMPDGRVRHTIIGPETVYVWYNSEKNFYSGPTGEISADHEQAIPTYETILDLSADQIVAADYRDFSGIPCIYVEAASLEEHTVRYWVSVDTGLLVAAEKLIQNETVYRMGALTADLTDPSAEAFLLPDGTVVKS